MYLSGQMGNLIHFRGYRMVMRDRLWFKSFLKPRCNTSPTKPVPASSSNIDFDDNQEFESWKIEIAVGDGTKNWKEGSE